MCAARGLRLLQMENPHESNFISARAVCNKGKKQKMILPHAIFTADLSTLNPIKSRT